MKFHFTSILVLITVLPFMSKAQFDFYGPQAFDQILENSYEKSWTPNALSTIENRDYIVLLDEAT